MQTNKNAQGEPSIGNPAAWLYEHSDDKERCILRKTRWLNANKIAGDEWVETPLYTKPQVENTHEAPDGAHEALQRLIENAAVLGPASMDDALVVSRYRRTLLTPR